MSKDNLPHAVDPFKLAVHGTEIHAHLKVRDMRRLSPSLYSDEGDVEVRILFGMDEQEVCVIRGHIKTYLMLQCQRCMESLSYEIITDFISGVVRDEFNTKNLPEGYTPVVAEDGMLVIQDMIEDELIVNLPVVSMHDPEECKIKLPYESGSNEPLEVNNPFKVISILRSKDEKKSS